MRPAKPSHVIPLYRGSPDDRSFRLPQGNLGQDTDKITGRLKPVGECRSSIARQTSVKNFQPVAKLAVFSCIIDEFFDDNSESESRSRREPQNGFDLYQACRKAETFQDHVGPKPVLLIEPLSLSPRFRYFCIFKLLDAENPP